MDKNNTKNTNISLVVACMDRLDNLLISLESWLEVGDITEYIVVDYSSKIPLIRNPVIKTWAKEKKITLIRVEGEKYFNLSKAYNLALDFTTNNNIIKIDADYKNINSSWIKHALISQETPTNTFIHGHWDYSKNLCGFFFVNKFYLKYYNENLEGWGFEDTDLYNRIRRNVNVNEIIWFNINDYIQHLDHPESARTKNYKTKSKNISYERNKSLCGGLDDETIKRTDYTISKIVNNQIVINFTKNKTKKLNRIYFINLKDKKDRWNDIKHIENIERIEAIDARNSPQIYKKFGFELNPKNLHIKVYFDRNYAVFGCLFSHYTTWKKIIDNKISYALILEDDVLKEDLYGILNCDMNILNGYDMMQLSKRGSIYKNKLYLNGSESYIITLKGAKKLVKSFEDSFYLKNVIIPEKENFQKFIIDNNITVIKKKKPTYKKMLVCNTDRFLEACCDENCDPSVRISYINNPIVSLNPEYIASDIQGKNVPVWEMSSEDILNFLKEKYNLVFNSKENNILII